MDKHAICSIYIAIQVQDVSYETRKVSDHSILLIGLAFGERIKTYYFQINPHWLNVFKNCGIRDLNIKEFF